jgi:hypothetical protein
MLLSLFRDLLRLDSAISIIITLCPSAVIGASLTVTGAFSLFASFLVVIYYASLASLSFFVSLVVTLGHRPWHICVTSCAMSGFAPLLSFIHVIVSLFGDRFH